MFHAMRNMTFSGTASSKAAAHQIRERLPPAWSVELRPASGDGRVLAVRAPDGREAGLAVVVRRRVLPREVPDLLRQAVDRGQRLLLVVPFLSPRSRELLEEGNASYADATGNLRVVASDPAIFLEGRGADQDPDRQPRPLRSLKGAAAGRVVRALCDFAPPYGVRTLAAISSTPLGTVSRVVSLLEEEALIARDAKKQIVSADWVALLHRWVRDYGVTTSNVVRSYLEPRGLPALGPKLGRLERHAITGSLAGTGIAAPRLAMLYVDDVAAAAEALELVPAEAGANVWLLEPFDEVVLERTVTRSFGLFQVAIAATAAAPSQVAADLLTSPGRGPQEGTALIEKMKETEDAWRRRP
jgi:hypothetical protein